MSVRLVVGDVDLTSLASNLDWSNIDGGGHETCTFEVPNDVFPLPGDPVCVWVGLQRVWMGWVEEPGDNYDERRANGQVAAVGAGAALKDGDVSMVFIDRALGRWGPPPRARELELITANLSPLGAEVRPSESGDPGLAVRVTGAWAATGLPMSVPWYDAGHGNLIGRIRGTWAKSATISAADTNWHWVAALYTGDSDASGFESTAELRAAGPSTIDLAATAARRYAALQLWYSAAGGVDNVLWEVFWTFVRVIGDHGLTVRGATPATEGFYPEDIAGWAVDQVDGINRGQFDASGFILPHSVYYTPVQHEVMVDDMAKLLGWHWGVWAPESLLSDTPEMHFRAPPADATATVTRAECRQLRLAQRLSDFHNQARVSYTDSAGTSASVLVTRANPRLPDGLDRVLPIDIGQADAAVATTVGEDTLELEEQQTRAAGSTELPATVNTTTGRKPAELLRPGIDRLKIVGLPNTGSWTDPDSRRFDTFRMRRTVSRVMPGGAVVTTAELDSGANLQETLNARLTLAAALAS